MLKRVIAYIIISAVLCTTIIGCESSPATVNTKTAVQNPKGFAVCFFFNNKCEPQQTVSPDQLQTVWR